MSAAGTGFAVAAFNRDAARADNGGLAGQPPPNQAAPLPLTEFEPRSMLHVRETRVARARFPVIDFHTHVSPRRGSRRPGVPPADIVTVMDAVNLQTMVNLTGGSGDDLTTTITNFDRAFPRRFLTMTEPTWDRAGQQGYASWQADEIAKAKDAGAKGLKILKTLGLYLRDGGPSGTLVRVDDARFDGMWEACGVLGLPVAMHVGDPEAFFQPIDRFNERYEELSAHPDWSFHGKDFPAFRDVLSARDRVFARHPKTTFVALHVGHWAENLTAVGEMLDKFPNVHVEIGRADWRARPAAANVDPLLRQVPGSDPVRHRRRSSWHRDAATGVRRGTVPDLLPFPRNRGRVLRLCAGAGAAAGSLEDLWPRAAGADPPEGVSPECGTHSRREARDGLEAYNRHRKREPPMPRIRTSVHVRLLAIAFFTLLPRPTGYAQPGQGPSTSTVTREQAAPFLGEWTIRTSSPFGPATYLLSLTSAGDTIRGTVKTANQPDVVVTNIRSAQKSLVLTYRSEFAGTPIPTVLILTPAGSDLRVDFSMMDGQFEMSGTGTKGNAPPSSAQPPGPWCGGRRRDASTASSAPGRTRIRSAPDDGGVAGDSARQTKAAATTAGAGQG